MLHEFFLAVDSAEWSFPAASVAGAVLAHWPEAELFDDPGGDPPVIVAVPDVGDRVLQIEVVESGQVVSLAYGSLELSAAVVAVLAAAFPPPDHVEVRLWEWGTNPRVTGATTAAALLAVAGQGDDTTVALRRRRQRAPRRHR